MLDEKQIIKETEASYPLHEGNTLTERIKKYFSPQKAPFWIANAIGVVALSSLATVAVIRYNRRRKQTQISFHLPDSIQGVEVGSNIRLKIVFAHQGTNKLVIRGEKRLLDEIVCDIRDTKLRLFCKPTGRKKNCNTEAFLFVTELEFLSLVGNARIDTEGINHSNQFTLTQHGGEIRSLQVESNRFSCVLSGEYSSNITYSGEELNLSAVGKGYSHFDLNANSLVCQMSGETSITLGGALHNLSLSLLGKGELLAENLQLPNAKLILQEKAKARLDRIESGTIALSGDAQLSLNHELDKKVKVALEETSTILFLEDLSPLQASKKS